MPRVDRIGLDRQAIARRHGLQRGPAGPSERRRRETVTCRLRVASVGAARGHSASLANSAATGCGARTASNVNSARCLPAGTGMTSPLMRGSSEPSIAICSTIAPGQPYARIARPV